jgi:hypothetical protein
MGAFKVAFEPKSENRLNYTTPYVYQEYPKWVTLADGSQIIVNDAEEEHAAIGPVTSDTGGDRDSLMAEAKALGLNPHHKTGVEKLQQLINESKGVSNA